MKMIITTKGQYALRVMFDLSTHSGDGAVSLKEIADRQQLSMKYLEAIIGVLHKADFVKSTRGKYGGYELTKSPAEYTVGSVLKLMEGTLSPVDCIDCGDNCERAGDCLTHPMWTKLGKLIEDYLESITIEDLLESRV